MFLLLRAALIGKRLRWRPLVAFRYPASKSEPVDKVRLPGLLQSTLWKDPDQIRESILDVAR